MKWQLPPVKGPSVTSPVTQSLRDCWEGAVKAQLLSNPVTSYKEAYSVLAIRNTTFFVGEDDI